MSDAASKAIETLVSIATDEDEDSDVRIRAAATILKDNIDNLVREEARTSS